MDEVRNYVIKTLAEKGGSFGYYLLLYGCPKVICPEVFSDIVNDLERKEQIEKEGNLLKLVKKVKV